MLRDGRSVANSYVQVRWWQGYRGVPGWTFGHLSAEEQSSLGSNELFVAVPRRSRVEETDGRLRGLESEIEPGRWLDLRYEDLVARPVDETSAVLRFAGLDRWPGLESRLAALKVSGGRTDAYRDELRPEDVELLEGRSLRPFRAGDTRQAPTPVGGCLQTDSGGGDLAGLCKFVRGVTPPHTSTLPVDTRSGSGGPKSHRFESRIDAVRVEPAPWLRWRRSCFLAPTGRCSAEGPKVRRRHRSLRDSADLRVAHVIRRFLPISETFIYTTLCAQADAAQAVFTHHRENELQFQLPDVRLIPRRRLGRAIAWIPSAALRVDPLFRAVRRFAPDVIHAHFGWNATWAMPVARGLSVPLVASFYGADMYVPGSVPEFEQTYAELFATGSIFRCVRTGGCKGAAEARLPIRPSAHRSLGYRPLPVHVCAGTTRGLAGDPPGQPPGAQEGCGHDAGRVRLWSTRPCAGRALAHRRRSRASGSPKNWHGVGISTAVHFLGSLPPAEVCTRMARLASASSRAGGHPPATSEGKPNVLLEMQARGVDIAATGTQTYLRSSRFQIGSCPKETRRRWRTLVRLAHLSERERNERLAAGRNLIERQHDARRIADQLRGIYAEAAAG